MFSNVHNMQDVGRMRPEHQQQWQRNQQALHALAADRQQAAQTRELIERRTADMRHAQEQLELQAYRREQDALADKAIPELRDPQKAPELQRAAVELLERVGINQESVAHEHPAVRRAIRSVAFQQIVAKAAKYDLAQARAKEITAVPLPPVQRPGVSRDHRIERANAAYKEKLQRLSGGGPVRTQIRAAAELLTEQRRARARGAR